MIGASRLVPENLPAFSCGPLAAIPMRVLGSPKTMPCSPSLFEHMVISPTLPGLRLQAVLILIITIIPPAIAQQDIFSFRMEGVNVDLNVTYDALGRPSRVTHYSVRTRQLRADEAFFHQVGLRDTTVIDTTRHAFDSYTWDESDELFCVTRWGPNLATTYYFGPDQEIAIRHLEREHTGRVGDNFTPTYMLKNRSTKPVTISFVDLPKHMVSLEEQWIIQPGDSIDVACRVLIQPGKEKSVLRLDNGRGRIPLGITTYGYHMSTDDLKNESRMVCPPMLEYYRTGSETLLEVVDAQVGEILQRFPVHSDRTLIDLESIGSRTFELCAKDFRHGTTTCTTIEVE
jgi:hypothetical protein